MPGGLISAARVPGGLVFACRYRSCRISLLRSCCPVCISRLRNTVLSLLTVSGHISVLGNQSAQTVGPDKVFFRSSGYIIISLDLIREGAEFFGDLTMEGRAAGGVIHIVRLGQDPQFIEEAVLRFVDPLLKSVPSLRLDKLIGILVGPQIDHRGLQAAVSQDTDIAQCGTDAGAVAVIGQKDAFGISSKKCRLAGRKCRSQRGHCLIKTRLVHGDHIHITLAEDQVVRLCPARQVQGVKISAFVEDHGVRRVYIFRLGISQDASAKPDHTSAHILDRKHDTIEKAVVKALFFIENRHIGFQDQFIGISEPAQVFREIVPRSVGKSKSEHLHGLRREGPVGKVAHPALSPPGPKEFIIVGSCFFVDAEQVLPVLFALFRFFTVVRCRKGDLRPVRKILQCLPEGTVVVLHQEGDRAPAGTAPEAVVKLLVRVYVERGRFFIMKRAQSHICAAPFFQMHMGRDHIHDICIREDLVHKLLRIIHPKCFPSILYFL